MAWRNTSEERASMLDRMIKGMAMNSGEIPARLVEPLDNILMISSDIELLKVNRKENLKPLVHQASGLIIVLWRLYKSDRYPSLWPPPPLNRIVDKFAKIVASIRKLLERKCEKKFVKKKIYMVLDMGKVKKYLCKLDAAATNIEGDPRRVVNINAMLLEAVNEYYNPQDDEAHLLGAIVPENVVEGSQQQEDEILSYAEIVEAIDEDLEAGTSTWREALRSQSSPPSPGGINASSPFNDTGSIEDDHGVETSSQASGETSPLSPHWQYINSFLNNTSGVMINRNVGNIYKTTITNVGNDNSKNRCYR